MRIEPFQLERWMTKYEMVVKWDIAESGIYPMTMREIVNLVPVDERETTLEALDVLVNSLKADEDASGEVAGIYMVGGASGLPVVPRVVRERFGRRVHRSPHRGR